MRSIHATVILSLGLLFGLGLGGCKNKDYPTCKKDKHCEEGESCVDNLCQNCTVDDECKGKGPQGEDLTCVNFRCEDAAVAGGECSTYADCEPGMICDGSSCQFCTDGSQCDSGVCTESGRCELPPCSLDDDCPMDEICDGGLCIYHPLDGDSADAVCGIAALYFGFDSAELSPGNQEQLTEAAACLGELLVDGKTLVMEAHADNVGTEEYNILLTDKRGSKVSEFLAGAGVPAEQMRVVGKGALESEGTDESTRTKDRRVEFIVE